MMGGGKFEALKKLLSKGDSKLDEQLMKAPFMRDKGSGISDDILGEGGEKLGSQMREGLIPSQVDEKKKAALLAALGLGGAGAAGYGMADD